MRAQGEMIVVRVRCVLFPNTRSLLKHSWRGNELGICINGNALECFWFSFFLCYISSTSSHTYSRGIVCVFNAACLPILLWLRVYYIFVRKATKNNVHTTREWVIPGICDHCFPAGRQTTHICSLLFFTARKYGEWRVFHQRNSLIN